MPDTDYVRRGEVNELRDRLVTVETNQGHAENSINALRAQMDAGFSQLSEQIAATNNRRTMFITIAGSAGGGVAVGLYEIMKRSFGW